MSNFSESSVQAFAAAVAHTRGYAVKIDTGNIVVATAATDAIIGTIDTPNTAGDNANVRLRSASGTAVGLAGAAVAVGAKVTSNGSGKLITTTTAGDEVVGIALTAAAGDGSEFTFMPTTGTHEA